MDENLAAVIVAPFYAMGVWGLWFGITWSMHKLEKMDKSAEETKTTERSGVVK